MSEIGKDDLPPELVEALQYIYSYLVYEFGLND